MPEGRGRRIWRQLRPISADGIDQLVAHWRTHVLTFVGIVWGASAIVLLLSVGAGFNQFLDLGFEKTGARYLAVDGLYTTEETGGARPGRRIRFDVEDLRLLEGSTPSARHVAAEIQQFVTAETPHRTRSTAVSAASPDIQHLKNHRIAVGRFFDERDERRAARVAVLGAELPELFYGSGDPIGRTLQLEGIPFQVVGVMEAKGFQLMTNNDRHDRMIFVPLSAGRRAFGHGRLVGDLILEPRRLDEMEPLRAEVRAVLWPAHHLAPGEEQAVQFMSVPEIMGPSKAIGLGLTILLGFIGTVTLAMAAVGVANLMVAVVNERRMELAVRRACGARRFDVMLQLLVETVVVVVSGGGFGVGIGLGLAFALQVAPLPPGLPLPQLSASVLATTFAVLVAVGLVAGIVPARLASRVDPGAALRAT